MAVGYDTGATGVLAPLAVQYSGGSWLVLQTPALARTDTSSSLTGVSCSAPRRCTAVGTSAGGVFVLSEAGGPWAIQTTPNPAASTAAEITSPDLTAVACHADSACLAVGNYRTTDGNSVTFSERWDGTGWSLTTLPAAGEDSDNTLAAISCVSPRWCLAVGEQTIDVSSPMSARDWAVTEQWTGSRWIHQHRQPVSPAGGGGAEDATNSLTAIACSAGNHCTAVGFAQEDDGCRHCGTLAERLGRHGWSLQRPSQKGTLTAVACPTTTRCVAVGGAAAQVWNGRAWTRTRIASPGATLTGIACPGRSVCVAVGVDQRGQVLVERSNGRTWWSHQAAPHPAGARHIVVSGVSCPSKSACVLVGSDRSPSGIKVSLVESYGTT